MPHRIFIQAKVYIDHTLYACNRHGCTMDIVLINHVPIVSLDLWQLLEKEIFFASKNFNTWMCRKRILTQQLRLAQYGTCLILVV